MPTSRLSRWVPALAVLGALALFVPAPDSRGAPPNGKPKGPPAGRPPVPPVANIEGAISAVQGATLTIDARAEKRSVVKVTVDRTTQLILDGKAVTFPPAGNINLNSLGVKVGGRAHASYTPSATNLASRVQANSPRAQ